AGFPGLPGGYEVVDMGTEFALNLGRGGKSRVMVLEGEAGVSVLGKDGRSVGGALLERQRSVEVDPGVGRIQDVAPQPDDFVELGEFVPPPLRLDPGYAEAILTAKPWGYWRFLNPVHEKVADKNAGPPGLEATSDRENTRLAEA